MKLSEYFEKTSGKGVLATSDAKGKVDVAVYSRPHFVDEENVAFIMADRLTHANLQSNPHAAYLFMEAGDKWVGKRLFLKKTRDEQNADLISKIRRKDACPVYEAYKDEIRFLVHFHIEKVLPLIGSGE